MSGDRCLGSPWFLIIFLWEAEMAQAEEVIWKSPTSWPPHGEGLLDSIDIPETHGTKNEFLYGREYKIERLVIYSVQSRGD